MITSVQNKIYKEVKALKSKKIRDEYGVFLAEGTRFISEIPENVDIKFFAVSKSFMDKNNLNGFNKKAEVFIFSDEVFKSLCSTENPQGIISVCKKLKNLDLNLLEFQQGFFIIAEELNDPGNLGTIIRTADACNVDAIFLTKGSVDLYNDKVLRSTMGSFFHVPVYQDIEIEYIIQKLHLNGIKIFAAHLNGKKYPYEFDLRKNCAIIIGNEARGISDKTVALTDNLIKIPMPGRAESLNAAVAASILMYEAVRQRIYNK